MNFEFIIGLVIGFILTQFIIYWIRVWYKKNKAAKKAKQEEVEAYKKMMNDRFVEWDRKDREREERWAREAHEERLEKQLTINDLEWL